MNYVGLTRGGSEGLVAIFDSDDGYKYFERIALVSLLDKQQTSDNKNPALESSLKAAIKAINLVTNLEDVPEFEGGIPQQSSLF